ncbi:MAG: GMC family oxidoreductase N-terminal domain-containing protein [Xanthomonadales bacterium]|nr:GMC family oxidoreductase N-terminal domain-containing protein [Xanthomonadales bacterium]
MSYDYIIIGAGSAGCVLAYRLSAIRTRACCCSEAGPRDWNPLIHMPAGFSKPISRKGLNWDYGAEPEPQLDQRRLWWPRGKVLGGSSSDQRDVPIRAMRDYDDWSALGAPGWD